MPKPKEPEIALAHNKALMLSIVAPAIFAYAGLEGHVPDPLDLPMHAGDMAIGGVLATAAVVGYAWWINRRDSNGRMKYVLESELSQFRKFGTVAVVAGMVAVGALTETKWGLRTVPSVNEVTSNLGNPMPSIWDTVYGAGWAALWANVGWKKRKQKDELPNL